VSQLSKTEHWLGHPVPMNGQLTITRQYHGGGIAKYLLTVLDLLIYTVPRRSSPESILIKIIRQSFSLVRLFVQGKIIRTKSRRVTILCQILSIIVQNNANVADLKHPLQRLHGQQIQAMKEIRFFWIFVATSDVFKCDYKSIEKPDS